jgi:beta-glucuronidase
LFFAQEGLERRLQICRQYVQELVARDKNHPSVIMWSLANEPHSRLPEAKPFFRNLYDLCKSLDPTRPVTVVSHVGVSEESFEFLDLMCLNRYYGWYSESGQLDLGVSRLAEEIDAMHEKFRKPLIMTEFGADGIPGYHAQPPEMFSEEYQVEFLTRYLELFKTRPFVVGEHIWNLCDFKTGQAVQRMGGMNLKGVLTRDRRPKFAAHRLRQLWQAD